MGRTMAVTGVVDMRTCSWVVTRAAALRVWERRGVGERWGAQSWVIYEQIVRLIWLRGRSGRHAAAYAWPSEAYLGRVAGTCRETVSRWVWRFQRAGMLRIVNRRPERGSWRTNLYHVGGAMVASLVRMTRRSTPHLASAAPPLASLTFSNRASVLSESHGELGELLERWRKRGAAAPGEVN